MWFSLLFAPVCLALYWHCNECWKMNFDHTCSRWSTTVEKTLKWKDWILLSRTIRYNSSTALCFPSSLQSICCTSSCWCIPYQEVNSFFQKCEWDTIASLALLNTAQNSVITVGLLAGTLYCGKLVGDGQLEVSTTLKCLLFKPGLVVCRTLKYHKWRSFLSGLCLIVFC